MVKLFMTEDIKLVLDYMHTVGYTTIINRKGLNKCMLSFQNTTKELM